MRGFPAEDAFEFFLAGDEHGGITGTARTQFARNLASGDALRRIDDLQDREAAAVADVQGFAGNAVDLLAGADVGIGNVPHLEVIAATRSIGRGSIPAQNTGPGRARSR